LKEIAMKTIIIATLLSVGVLLRPEMAPTGSDIKINDVAAIATPAGSYYAVPRILERSESESIQGGGFMFCYKWYDENLDEHGVCCLNFWIFRLCFDVNVSEAERLISSVF
jgi:hypothetical protein